MMATIALLLLPSKPLVLLPSKPLVTARSARVLLHAGSSASAHSPIMAAECLERLALAEPAPSGSGGLVVVDCTLGLGGHSDLLLGAMAERLETGSADHAQLVAFELERDLLEKADARLSSCSGGVEVEAIHANFATIGSAFAERPKAHALLADLGCSSPQLDDAARGFSWRAEGFLDMRMNTPPSAAARPAGGEAARAPRAALLRARAARSTRVAGRTRHAAGAARAQGG